MRKIAKLFKIGRSQAVRLSADFRFSSREVFIRKNSESGDIVLSRKPGSWDDLLPSPILYKFPRTSSLPASAESAPEPSPARRAGKPGE